MIHTSQTAISSKTKSIVFFGTEEFSCLTLAALIENGYTIAAVVTKPDSKQGRGQKITKPHVKLLAEAHGIPVWQPAKLTDITKDVRALDSPAGVLVSYGKIIPQSIIELFTPGIINVHPSLLPHYRGPSPIETAILNGDQETGVSIMQLSAAMDAGPVYAQTSHQLQGDETSEELYKTLGKQGVTLLLEVLPNILTDTIAPRPQDDTQATYCQLIKKTDGVIDWKSPARSIERQIRAYQEWPKSRTQLGSIDVIISAAHVVQPASQSPIVGSLTIDPSVPSLSVQTGSGQLILDTVKPIGKKEMPIQAFLSGYASQLKSTQ